MIQRLGPTAGLAVILTAVQTDGGPVSVVIAYPYLLGVAVVLLAWSAWFGCAGAIRRAWRLPAESTVTGGGVAGGGVDCAHATRVGVAVGVAVALAALLPGDMVGGHWLVTSVLLTIQPGRYDTGVRLVQRISGNTVGALIAAAVLGAHPAAPVVVTVTVVLFLLAMALRPVNYTWWAVTGPPVLLMISEYPQLFPWYEGEVRLAMNIGGAAIVLAVVFVLPALSRRRRPRLPIAIDFG
jgi:fusaric acid resistance family protein